MAPHIAPPLHFPHPEAPPNGSMIEVAPGVMWFRLPLPFSLDHINVYLIEDDGGWAVLDTGIDNQITRDAWDAALTGPLAGARLTRVIATHFHPDHIGLVGWLTERFELPLAMSRTEYFFAQTLRANSNALRSPAHQAFYHDRGLPAEISTALRTQGLSYLGMVTGLPTTYTRLIAGHDTRIGGRNFRIYTGGGHALEQVMLYCAADRLFFAADQVIAKISPNVSVWPWEPTANPLGEYLQSLADLRRDIDGDAYVLSAHNLPFVGVHSRIDALLAHHRERCDRIAVATREKPCSAGELVPVLFQRPLDPHQTGFAFGEVLAHVNFMLEIGELRPVQAEPGDVMRVTIST